MKIFYMTRGRGGRRPIQAIATDRFYSAEILGQGPIDDMKRTARKSCWSGRPEMRDLIDRHEDTELEPPHRGGARHHSGPGPHGSPGPRGGPGPHRGRGQNTRYSGDNRQPHPFRDRSYNGRERDNDNRNNDRIRDSEFVNDRDRISETNRNIYRHDDRRSGTYKSDFHSNKEPFRKNEQSKNHRSRSRDRDSRRSGSRDSRRRSRSRDFKRRSRSRDLSRRSKSRDSKRSSSRDSRRSKSRDIESSGKNQIKSMVVNKLKKDDQSSDLSSQESSPMRSWKNERFKDSRNKKPIASELKNQSSIICISSKDDLKKSKAVNDKRLDDDILMNNEIRSDGTSPFNNDAPEIIVTVQCDSLEKPKKKPFERRVSKEEEIKDKAEKTNDSSSKQDEMKKCDQTFPKSNFAAAESEITDTRTEISKSNDKVLKDRENQSSEQDTIVKKSQVTSSKSAKVTNTQEVKRKSISESTQSEKSKMSDPGITMNVKSVDKSKVVQETSGSSSNNCSKSENSDLNISTNLNPKNSFKDQRRSSSDYNKAKLCENSTVNSSKTSDQKQTAWSLSSKNHQNKENGENTNKAEERLVVKHKEPNIISDTVKTSLKHGTRLKTDNGNQSAKTMEAKMTGKVKIDISENVAPVITNNKPDNKRSLDSQSLDRLKKEISGLGVKPRRKSVEFDKHMGINNESGNFERKLESISNKTTFNNTVDANENNKKVTELLPNNSEVDKETDRSEIRIRRKSGKESLLSNNSEVETDRSEIRIRRKSGKEPLQPADNRSVSIDEPNQPKSDKLSHQMPSENVTFDLVGQILRAGEKREKRRNSGNHSSSVKPTVESNDMKSTSSKSTIITSTPLKEAKQTDSKVKGTENVIDENATNGETELPSFVQVCLDRSQSVCDRVNTFEKLDKENPELLFKKNVPRKSLFLETNKKSMKNLSSLRGQMDLNAKPVTKPSLFASKFTHKKDTVVSNPSVQDVPLPENEKPRSSEKMLKIRSGASNQIKLMKTNQPSSWKDKNKKQDFSPKKKNLFSKKKRDRSPLLHRKLNKSQDALKNKSPNASVGQARTNIFESLSKNFVPSAHEKKKDGLSVKNVDKHHVKRTAKENPKTGSANEKLKPSGNVQTQQDKDKPNGHQPKSRSKIETSQSDQPKSLSDIEKSLNDQAMSLSHIEKSLRDHPKIRSNIEKSQSDQPKSPTLETSSLESARISKDKTKHILKASHTNLPSCIVPLGKDALKRRASCERKMETTSVSVGIENKPQTTEDCLNASSNLTLNSKKMERAAMTAGEIAECDENSNEKTNSDIISQELSQQSDSSIDTLTCQAVIEECLNEMTRPSSASTADLCSNREQTGKSEDNIMNVDKSENNDGENLQTPKHKQDGMNIVDQTHTKDKTCDNDNSKVPSVITDDDIEDDDFCLIDINPYTTHAKAVIADSKVSECSSNDATKDNTNDLYDDKAVPVIESMTENSSNFAEEMYEPHTSDISDDEDAAEYETRKRTCNMTIKYCDDRVFIESNEQAINQRINEKNTPVDHIQDKGESSTCNVNNVRNKVVSVPDDSNKRNKVASVTNDNSERNKVTSACNDSNEVNKVASVSNDNSERNNVASACNDSSERNKVASVSNDNSGRNKVASVSNDNSGRSKVASVPNDKNERNKVASVPNDKSEQNKVASACNDSSERNKVAFVPNENSGRNKVDPVPNDDSEQNKVAYACNDNSEGNKLASVRNSPSINTREKSDNQKLCKRKNSVTSSAESPEDSVQPKKIKVDNEAYTPDKTHDVKNEQSFKKQLKFKSDSPMKLTPRKRNYADILASASKGFDEPASPDNKSSDKEDKQSVKNGKLKRKLSKDEIENDSDLGTTESPSKKKRTDHKDVESPKDRKKEMKKALEKAKMTIKVPVNNGKKRLSTSDSSCLPISESYSKALPMEHDALPMEKEAVLRGKEAVPMEKEICEESTAILEQTNEVVVSEHQDPNSPDSVSSDDKALETPPVQLSECSVESSIPVLKNGFNVSHTLTLKDLRRVTTIGHLDPQRVYSGQRCILCQVCMNYFTPLQFTFHHDSSSIVCNIDGEKSMRNSYHPEHPNIIHWNEEAGKIWDEFEKIFEREKRKALSSTPSKSKSFHENKTVGQTVCDSQKSPRGVSNKTVEPTSSSNVAISPDKQKVMIGASNMTINKTNQTAQQNLKEPSKLKVSDIHQSKETSNVRTSEIQPTVQQKLTETSNVTKSKTSPDQQTVKETPVAVATNSKQTVQQNLTETTNQKVSPVKPNMETSLRRKLTDTSNMVTSPDQQKCKETSNLPTSLFEQNDTETNTLATKTKQTIQQEHTEISNPQVSAVQKSVETSNVKISQTHTNIQQTANVMTSRDQQKDSETSNKLVTNKQNVQQNSIETLNLKVCPLQESSTEISNSTVSNVSRASTEILYVRSPTRSVVTERENSTMVQDNSFKHQPTPIFESSLLSEDELLAALWKKFNLNIADNDYCNLMLGYKLQLRSGLRINQRRTQAFAAAAAHPGQFRTEDEICRHNATNSMLWKQRKVIEAKVRKSSSLERHLEQLSTRNLEQSSTRNLEQSSTRHLEQLSSRNLEQSTKNPEQLSTRKDSNKGAREEMLKHTNGTSI